MFFYVKQLSVDVQRALQAADYLTQFLYKLNLLQYISMPTISNVREKFDIRVFKAGKI